MELGIFEGSRSPSKAVIFDWEHLIYMPKAKHHLKEIESKLIQTSREYPQWASLIFNRSDEDLFYGIIMEIWTEAEIFLNNQGVIQWEYFPCYAQMLGAFLG